MQRDDLLATIERLSSTDVDVLDRDELATTVADTARVRGWLDALELRCTRHGRTLAEAGRAEAPANLLAANSQRSSRDAELITRRSAVADAMPTFERELGNGSISAAHLDAIANANRHAPADVRAAFAIHEHELMAHAAGDSIDTFTRRCRALVAQLAEELSGNDSSELDRQRAASRIRRYVTPSDGMHHTDMALDPLRDELVWNAINRTLRSLQQRDGNARTPWHQLQTDALVATILNGPGRAAPQPATPQPAPTSSRAPSPAADIADDLVAAIDASLSPDATSADSQVGGDDHAWMDGLGTTGEYVAEVSVLIDLATLIDGLHEHSICETEDGTPLPVSTIRRLCCDADIVPVVLGSTGETLDVGRTRRTVNRAQRRALRAMHRTCAEPQCTVPYSDCKIHHVRWWWRDSGTTDIDNLLPLCERHHHLVHEGGWILTMTPERIATWTRPDGTIHHRGTAIDRRPTNRTSRRQPASPTAAGGNSVLSDDFGH